MAASDAALFGLARAQRMAEEDENAAYAWPIVFEPGTVPRLFPPPPPMPKRTWEELVEDTARIRADWLKIKAAHHTL